MPTVKELISIVDYSRSSSTAAIEPTHFPNSTASNFWSASAYAYSSASARFVDFRGHFAFYDGKSSASQVRLVRAGQ